MGMELLARVKKALADVETNLKASEGGALHTLPYHIQWTAKGYSRSAIAVVAVAALIQRPTTTAAIQLGNNEAGGGKVYVMERGFAHQLVHPNFEIESGLHICVHPVGTAMPDTNDITVRNSSSGLAAGSSLSIFDINEGVNDDGWFPWGDWTKCDETGVTPGGHVEAAFRGRIIIPPKAAISMHVVAGTTGSTFTCGFHWFEVPQSELGLGV
ncbi:hypothetical protein LCGC14_1500600 [marine sediment metagenome]|uniref:Uncharacterized protein n=1 Tax=marine sediment metagenome TaxID=412755 RepID=A0A0F9JQ25_9ZZZZ